MRLRALHTMAGGGERREKEEKGVARWSTGGQVEGGSAVWFGSSVQAPGHVCRQVRRQVRRQVS